MFRLAGRETVSEKELVKDIRNGSQKAMKKVYDSYAGYLLAVCTRYIPDRDTAEDLLQDSFVKIFASIGSFKSMREGSLKAWMRRITVNEALMYLRRQKKFSFMELRDTLPDVPEDEDPGIDTVPAEIDTVPADVLQKMIRNLSDGYRTVFNLFVFENRSHKEIAEMLGISESTSASQFHRARKMLAKEITEYNRKNGTGLDR